MNVLKADKELVVFPIVSSVALVVVSLAFLIPMILANIVDGQFQGFGVFGYVVLFLFYIVQYFIIIFSNTALVGAALIRLRGGDPTVSDGLNVAASRLGPILGYSLIAGTVGMILRTISDRNNGFLGQLVLSVVQFSWNVATFLVVPILAVENVGPIEAIKRSSAYLKKTWGEQIVGNFTIGGIFALIYIAIIVAGVALTIGLAAIETPGVIIVGVLILFVLALMVSILIGSTLNSIYVAAVYQFAADGTSSGAFFDPNLVQQAFRQK